MKFEIMMNDKTIHAAALLVSHHYNDNDFLFEVKYSGLYKFTKLTPALVAQKIEDASNIMIVMPYKTWNPYSKVIGYAEKNIIYVNTRKLHLPLKDRVENFMHESLHSLGFGHDGNRVTDFNLKTVPYKCAAIFVKYLEGIGKL